MSSNGFSMDSATEVSSINSTIAEGMTPGLLGIFTLVIVIYYYVFYSVGIKSGEMKVYNKSFGTMFLEIILWGLFLLLLGINTLQYYYDINIVTEIKKCPLSLVVSCRTKVFRMSTLQTLFVLAVVQQIRRVCK